MNWVYIAGFFDGEGSIGKHTQAKNYWRISIGQKSKEVLYMIKEFTKMGAIYQENSKDMYRYQIWRQDEVYRFVTAILSHTVVKKSQLEKYLKLSKKC